MSQELRDLFNVEVDEFQKKAKVSSPFSIGMSEPTSWLEVQVWGAESDRISLCSVRILLSQIIV